MIAISGMKSNFNVTKVRVQFFSLKNSKTTGISEYAEISKVDMEHEKESVSVHFEQDFT